MATATRDEGYHEIQLNGKQLIFLFMAGTVVVVVIFLLGVFVGRGVQAPLQADAMEPSTPAALNGATADGPASPELAAGPGFAAHKDVTPASAPAPDDGTPVSARENLSYADRLSGTTPPRERLSEAPRDNTRDNSRESTRDTPGTPVAAMPERPPAAPSSAAAADVPGEPSGSGFAIQLAALGKRDDAESIVRRLTGKGYAAYVNAPAAGAPAVFRVRVGKFKDRREAERVSARLQKEEQFKPWIVP